MKDLTGKKVYVLLTQERRYTGVIDNIIFLGKNESGADIHLIELTDKYGKFVAFNSTEIKIIEEVE